MGGGVLCFCHACCWDIRNDIFTGSGRLNSSLGRDSQPEAGVTSDRVPELPWRFELVLWPRVAQFPFGSSGLQSDRSDLGWRVLPALGGRGFDMKQLGGAFSSTLSTGAAQETECELTTDALLSSMPRTEPSSG